MLASTAPDVGNWWYLITLASPLAGQYYWSNAERKEQVKVKMVTLDDDSETEVIVEGDREELERFARSMKVVEKGKVYVKGLFEA